MNKQLKDLDVFEIRAIQDTLIDLWYTSFDYSLFDIFDPTQEDCPSKEQILEIAGLDVCEWCGRMYSIAEDKGCSINGYSICVSCESQEEGGGED